MLTFRIINKCWQDATYYKDDDVDFLLEENDWNDYYFYTTYHLHVTSKRTGDKKKGAIYLGPISIMRIGQSQNEKRVLRSFLHKDTFILLPDDFISLTFYIEVYRGLSTYLTFEERLEFIKSLNLLLKESDKFYDRVKDDVCFQTSLLRGSNMNNYYLLRGRELLLHEGIHYNLREKVLSVKFSDSDTPINLDFSAIKGIKSKLLSNGVVAFIGKNGSGKSTALYKLAALLYATPSDRDRYMREIGSIEPLDIGISRLMIFSYSPFDNFMLPGENVETDLKLWVSGIKRKEGRFIFCGLRDVEKEAVNLINEKKIDNNQNLHLQIRSHNIELKPQSILAEESYDAFQFINETIDLKQDMNSLFFSIRNEQNDLFQKIQELIECGGFDFNFWNEEFNKLSTGHKFFIHSMLHIIAYCEENSLLLFDEPENHLQAPLLSFMMAEIREILSKRSSVMLIATHSPVILQETLSTNVRIVRRFHDKTTFSKPTIETFGESFGTISSEVFDLNTDRVHFFDTIDEVYKELRCDEMNSADEVVERIKQVMGGISSQALNYVVSKYISKGLNRL